MATNLFVLHTAIILSFLYVCNVYGAPVRYDQSQFGDYNVQIHLKNIELYAILDEGILNNEYDYDYSELTEKPSTISNHHLQSTNGTTARPVSNITSGHGSTGNYSSSNSNPLSSINSSAIVITNQLLATPEQINATAVNHHELKVKQPRPCNPGYLRDPFGRCRRYRKPQLAYQQTVHTPGVIKSFQPHMEKSALVSNH